MERDIEIFALIEEEHKRQARGIELIASENSVSPQVMEAMGSCLTNKYAEGYPGKRYYGGCEVVDKVEQLAIDRVCKLFGAEYANVQPHSGAQANAAVLLTVLNPGDTFMGLNLDHGGHLSHGSLVNTSGILYKPVGYNLNRETGRVDYNEMERLAKEHKPKLIIGGGSAYSREWDYERMRKIADEVGALLMIDMAHPAGLIAAGLLENPVKWAHIVTSTTHKTLRGPRGGIILMGKDFPNPWGKKTPKGRGQDDVGPAQQCRIPRTAGRSAGARHSCQGRSLRRGSLTFLQGVGPAGEEERCRTVRRTHEAWFQHRERWYRQPLYAR